MKRQNIIIMLTGALIMAIAAVIGLGIQAARPHTAYFPASTAAQSPEALPGRPGPEPWWLVKAYSGTTPEYQTVQSWTRPDPSKTITGYGTKATVSGPYATQAAAQAAAPAGAQWGQGGPIQTSPTG